MTGRYGTAARHPDEATPLRVAGDPAYRSRSIQGSASMQNVELSATRCAGSGPAG